MTTLNSAHSLSSLVTFSLAISGIGQFRRRVRLLEFENTDRRWADYLSWFRSDVGLSGWAMTVIDCHRQRQLGRCPLGPILTLAPLKDQAYGISKSRKKDLVFNRKRWLDLLSMRQTETHMTVLDCAKLRTSTVRSSCHPFSSDIFFHRQRVTSRALLKYIN